MSDLDRLTERQREVYDFIREKIRGRGYGPTVREIGGQFDISSPNGVMCHLKALEKKGLIQREPNMSRAIMLASGNPYGDRALPLVGQVAAGSLTEAIEEAERIDFGDLYDPENHFVLRVKGDSMIEAQIADGDLAVIRKQKTAHAGDIVVAQTEEGEATLKYWFPEARRIRLQPANSAMKPIYVESAQVLGVLVGVFRRLKR